MLWLLICILAFLGYLLVPLSILAFQVLCLIFTIKEIKKSSYVYKEALLGVGLLLVVKIFCMCFVFITFYSAFICFF